MSRLVRLALVGFALHGLQATTACAQAALPAGTTVVVSMVDAVDSGRDPAGKQYRASVVKPIVVGTDVVAPGAAAIVVLTRTGADWIAQLKSVAISGQAVAVTSAAATVVNSAQTGVAKGANAVNSVLKVLGRPARAPQAVAAVASGQRVVLPSGTALTFVLGGGSPSTVATAGTPTPSAVPAASPAPNAAGTPSAPATPQAPLGGQLNATVTETLLGPKKEIGQYIVSPDGGHMAVASMHGSREIVIVDGVDGPEFDHAGRVGSSLEIDVAFSNDGKRSAYIARKGDQLVAVVDGKEAFTVVANSKIESVPGIDPYFTGMSARSQHFLFSPSGAHVAVVAYRPGLAYMFLDGVKGGPYAEIDLKQLAFVAEKLVFAVKAADQKWHMVVNDQLGPGYDAIAEFVVSSNKQHYAYIGRTGGSSVVVADGIPGTPRPNVVSSGLHNLVIAANGRVAYQGYSSGGGPYKEPLYVDDKEVSPETSPFSGPPGPRGLATTPYVVFSPDGSKFAYARPAPGGIATVIDGKQSRAYDRIGFMQFGPDSRRAFFVGNKQVVGNFVVIDGQEMPMQNTVKNFVFSQDGSRFGYEGYSSQTGFSFVVDGKPSANFLELIAHSLAFSADGKHSVYAGCTNYGQCQLVQDGAVQNVRALGPFTSRSRPPVILPPVLFSPDGSKMVYVAPRSDGTNQSGVMMNGQAIVSGGHFEFPSFSSDSKHFVTMAWTGKGYTVVDNGKVGPTFDDIFEANGKVVRFLDAHTLRLLVVKGGSVYRVTVDLQ